MASRDASQTRRGVAGVGGRGALAQTPPFLPPVLSLHLPGLGRWLSFHKGPTSESKKPTNKQTKTPQKHKDERLSGVNIQTCEEYL